MAQTEAETSMPERSECDVEKAIELSTDLESETSTEKTKGKNLITETYPQTVLDDGIVGWDSQDDPENPRNFKSSRKWTLLGFISAITFLSPLASSMNAPGASIMDADLNNTSSILSSLSVSIFVLGFATGPLVLSPLSEIYGRQPILNVANIFLTVWQIGCALAPNVNALIVFRFFSGVGGSACLTIGGGVIADLFVVEHRGMASALFTVGPLFGPVIGPIIGGFVAQRAGWRWVYWVLLCATGVFTIGNIILNSETNHKVLVQRKTQRLRKELNRPELQSAYDASRGSKVNTTREILIQSTMRPLRILFRSPILLFLAIYLSFVFGCLYLLFTTIGPLFASDYNWQVEFCGLAYLGMGIGFVIGLVVIARTSDATVVRLTKANNNVYAPEMRLASSAIFSLFIPISFFWYGWTADKHVHWIVPIIALAPFGFGLMGVFLPVQTYFIDAGGQYAASAIAGLTAVRCLFGTFLPLAGPSMYSSLGLGWGNSLLGFIALGLVPVPLIIFRYGGTFREKHPIRLD